MGSDALPNFIIADQGLYKTFVGAGLDILDLEKVEAMEGKAIAVPSVEDAVRKWTSKQSGLRGSLLAGWQRKILEDGGRYFEVQRLTTSSPDSIDSEISRYGNDFTKAVRLLNGATASDDCEVLGFAAWVVERTDCGACVVTEDGDLLAAGHALSSYVGSSLKVRSVFEVLKSAELSNAITAYCKYWKITDDEWYRPGGLVPAGFQDFLTQLARKSRVAFHPKLNEAAVIRSLLVK